MSQYFPGPHENFSRNAIFEFDIPNYATNVELKGAAEQTCIHRI